MNQSLASFADDRISRFDVRIGTTSSGPSSNTTGAHTPESYRQSSIISDVVYDRFGNAWSNWVPCYDGGSIDLQFEQTLPVPDNFDPMLAFSCPNPPGSDSLQPCNAESGTSKTIETDLYVSRDYHKQQCRMGGEGMQSLVSNSSSTRGGSPLSLTIESNISIPTVNLPQAIAPSDNRNNIRDALWSNIREVSPESGPGNSQLPWRKNIHNKRPILFDNNQCPICNQTFKRRDNIKPHVFRKHPRQYGSLYTMSRSTSAQPGRAPATYHPHVHGESKATHDLGCYQTQPPTDIFLEGEESQKSNLPQCDVSCSGHRKASQKRSLDSVYREDLTVRHDSEKKPALRLGTGCNDPVPPLACPFQKRYPGRYQRCFALSLQRIKDVKQHIYRCHTIPKYYCASCFKIFNTANDRDEHSRQRECNRLNNPYLPHFEGITEDQRQRLNEKSSRTMDVEGQWLQIWFVIFPNATVPRSVYLGNCFQEMVPLFRREWESQRSNIMAHVGAVDTWQLSFVMNCAMDVFFESLEGQIVQYGMRERCMSLMEV